ncbi:MAG: hypothetical protein Q9173_000922 [Seirophora scorigena]
MAGYYPAPSHSRPPPHRRTVAIDFLTCGLSYRPNLGSTPCILSIKCHNLAPPSRNMCLRYSGLDRELSDWLFARREYRVKYQRALDKIEDALDRWRPGRDGPRLVAIVKCKAGVHRSVAMAEKLAKEVKRWKGVRTSVEYVVQSLSELIGVGENQYAFANVWDVNRHLTLEENWESMQRSAAEGRH